jgi:hypothetical protein
MIAEPDFDAFDHEAAWRLGRALVARRRGHPVLAVAGKPRD